MKKLVIALAGLVILGGGGAGAYLFLFKKPAEAAIPPAAAEEHAPEQANEHASAGDGHGAAPAGPTFVKLDPLVVPVMDSEGASQVISLVINLEVADQAGADKVTALQPRIKDAFIQDLYTMVNDPEAMNKGALNVGLVKTRLQATATRVVGEGVVEDVLLQMVQQNPI